jgi:hypothetical protein
MIGRIEVQPSNVTYFLNKERVGGELETAVYDGGLDGEGPKQMGILAGLEGGTVF